MKLRTTLFSFAAVLLLGSISLVGCTTEDEPGTPADGVTRVAATIGTDHMTVSGLSEGQLYFFAVKGGTGTIKGLSSNGSGSIVVTWNGTIDSIFYKKADATATSFTADGITYSTTTNPKTAMIWATVTKFGPITLYEDGTDSGLDQIHVAGLLINPTGVTTVSTRFGPDINNYDFKLRTTPPANAFPNLVLEPGVRSNINDTRKAEMGDGIYVVGAGADRDYYAGGFNSQMNFSPDNYWVVPTVDELGNVFALGANAMIPVKIKQADGSVHYARIEVISAPNPNTINGLWHEDPSHRSITLNVYYQTVAGWDYATPREAGNSGH